MAHTTHYEDTGILTAHPYVQDALVESFMDSTAVEFDQPKPSRNLESVVVMICVTSFVDKSKHCWQLS